MRGKTIKQLVQEQLPVCAFSDLIFRRYHSKANRMRLGDNPTLKAELIVRMIKLNEMGTNFYNY